MWLDPSKPQEIFQVSQHCPFLLNHVLNSNKASLQEYTNTHTQGTCNLWKQKQTMSFTSTAHSMTASSQKTAKDKQRKEADEEVRCGKHGMHTQQDRQCRAVVHAVQSGFWRWPFKEVDTGGCGDHATMKTESRTKPCTLWSLASTAGYTKEREMIVLKDVDTHTRAHGTDLQWEASKCVLIRCPFFTWVGILT